MAREETAAGPLHALPADLEKALATDRAAKATWDDITPLARMSGSAGPPPAKLVKTRERRIAVASTSSGRACAGRAVGRAVRTDSVAVGPVDVC